LGAKVKAAGDWYMDGNGCDPLCALARITI
jgi:hypothetical protein